MNRKEIVDSSAETAGPVGIPLDAVTTSSGIIDLEERAKEFYRDHLKPGDKFALNYDRMHVSVRDFKLHQFDPQEGKPISLDVFEYRNDSSTEREITFSKKKSSEAEASLSVTAGMRYKHEVTAGISLSKIIDVGGSHELEFSLSSTAKISKKTLQEWEWEFPLSVPPRTRLEAQALVTTIFVKPRFTVDCEISVDRHPEFDPGYHPVYASITRDNKTHWYRASLQDTLAPTPTGGGFLPGSDVNTVLYRCEGEFHGVYGRKMIINVTEYPLDGGAPLSTKSYEVREDGSLAPVLTLVGPEEETDSGVLASLS